MLSLSCVWSFVTSWTVACQTPLFMELPRQEYWSGLPFSTPGYVCCVSCIGRQILDHCATWKAPDTMHQALNTSRGNPFIKSKPNLQWEKRIIEKLRVCTWRWQFRLCFLYSVSHWVSRRRYETGRSQVHKFSTLYSHELSPWDSIRPIEKVLVFWTLLGFKLLRNKRSPLLSHCFTANAVLCQRTEPRPSLVGFYNLDLIIRCQFCLVFFLKEHFLMYPTAEIKGWT